jgi:hypothetical protein
MVGSKTPIEIGMSIASINEAVRYWLSNVVFRDDVIIENISFNERDHFTKTFQRTEGTDEIRK